MATEPNVIELPPRIAEELQRRAERDRALCCYAPAKSGDLAAAVAACESAGAVTGCFRAAEVYGFESHGGDADFRCPRARLANLHYQAAERLRKGDVGRRAVEILLAAEPGRVGKDDATLLPVIPLARTDALALVQAFIAKKPAHVTLTTGGAIDFGGDETSLVLAGPPGVGKSIAAVYAVAREGGRLLPARRLQDLDLDLAGYATTGGVLVIDDLGCEYAGQSGWAVARATELLEWRHANAGRLIITTNLRRPDFAARYGARVDDRLREGAKWINAVGESLRGRA